MRVMEAASEIGLEHDWLDPGFTLFRPAQSPPSAVRRSPVSVSCPVLSSKFLFTSVRTCRATGDSSCTAVSKWASLSFRLADPPCVPSRRSSKWRIRLVIYAGIALSGIAYLPTNKSNLTTQRQQAHPLWTTRNLEPCSQSRCSDPSTLCRIQESGEHVARQRCKRHFQATVAVADWVTMRYAKAPLPLLPGPPVACHRNPAESGLLRRRLH